MTSPPDDNDREALLSIIEKFDDWSEIGRDGLADAILAAGFTRSAPAGGQVCVHCGSDVGKFPHYFGCPCVHLRPAAGAGEGVTDEMVSAFQQAERTARDRLTWEERSTPRDIAACVRAGLRAALAAAAEKRGTV